MEGSGFSTTLSSLQFFSRHLQQACNFCIVYDRRIAEVVVKREVRSSADVNEAITEYILLYITLWVSRSKALTVPLMTACEGITL